MVVTETEVNGYAAEIGDVAATATDPSQPPPTEEPMLTMEEVVTKDVVESILREKDPDLELVDFTVEAGTQAGDNYMSVMYAANLSVQSKKTGKPSKLHIMLKTMPQNLLRQQMINECQAFIKDGRMYSQVFPDFIRFQKERGLENDEIFCGFPECYAVFQDGKRDYLAMQNLRFEGYKMGARIKGLDFDHCEVVMKNMANFHAISYAMFKGDYDSILKAYPFLEEKMFLPEEKVQEMSKQWLGSTIVRVTKIIKDAGYEKESENIELFYKEPSKYWNTMHKLVGCKVPQAVIGHGDCWTNNFLFKYDEKTGKPVSLKFVDFQISRVSSRCVDMGYFLYTSPEMSVLNNRKADLVRIYFDEFNKCVKRLGVNEEDLQTFEEFTAEVEDFRYYGISMGVMLLPIISASSEDVPDMELASLDMSEEAVENFFGDILKSNAAEKKLVNLAKNHCTDVKYLHRD